MATVCPAEENLGRFIEGALPAKESAALEAHVEQCDACQVTLSRLTTASGLEWVSTGPSACPGSLIAPLEVPGYEIEAEVGRGGYGVVYCARELATGRAVAIKVLRGAALSTPAEYARFRAEARAAANLRHPNVVTVLAVGQAHELPYYVMEYLPAGSLARRFDGTPLDPVAAATLIEAVAGAVQYAHDCGVIHRDLKPGNILLDLPPGGSGLGAPKVSDFGMAKYLEAGPVVTPTQAVLGTPSYMAPEQAFGHSRDVGPSADVYALGAILYELLTGRPPFRGGTPYETLLQVRTQEAVSPRRLRPGLPRDLETVCLKCLEKDPHRRYPSAAALAADLRAFREGRPVTARSVGWPGRIIRWSRRNPMTAGLLGLLVGVGVASLVGLATLWRRAETDAARATAKAVEAERRQQAALEALRLYTAAAVTLYRNPATVGSAERASLIRGLELYEQVLAETEGDPDAQHRAAYATLQLADGLRALNEHDWAARACRRAVEVLRRLAAEHPDNRLYVFDYSQGCAQLGATLHGKGPSDEVLPLYREAVRVGEELVARYPTSDHYRGALASYRTHLGYTLAQAGAIDEAEGQYAAARPVTIALLDKYPHDPQRYAYYSTVITRWAELRLTRCDDLAGYARLMAELLDRCDRARADRPADWWLMVHGLNPLHCEMAWVLGRAGRRDEARAVLLRGAALWQDAAKVAPAALQAPVTYAQHLIEAGYLEWPGDQAAGAELFRRAAGVLERAVADSGGLPTCRMVLAELRATCPDSVVRDPKRALDEARAAIADPRCHPDDRWKLGVCLYEAGEFPAAVKELDEFIRTRSGWEIPHLYLAMALWRTGDRDRAKAELRAVGTAIRANQRTSTRTLTLLEQAEAALSE